MLLYKDIFYFFVKVPLLPAKLFLNSMSFALESWVSSRTILKAIGKSLTSYNFRYVAVVPDLSLLGVKYFTNFCLIFVLDEGFESILQII